MITLRCVCGERIRADKALVGQAVRCHQCGSLVVIPPRSPQTRFSGRVVVLAFFLGFAAAVWAMKETDRRPSKPQTAASVHRAPVVPQTPVAEPASTPAEPVDDGVRSLRRLEHGQAPYVIAADWESWKAYWNATDARETEAETDADYERMEELERTGRTFRTMGTERLRILEYREGIAHVRFLDGPHSGKEGWMVDVGFETPGQ